MTKITDAMLRHYNDLAARAEASTLQDCIARAEAAEAECARLREQVDNLRRGLAHWKEVAETESWPYEWDVATVLKDERDEARGEVARLREWIVAACNHDNNLMPPSGIEIAHKVSPWPGASWQRAHDGQDAS